MSEFEKIENLIKTTENQLKWAIEKKNKYREGISRSRINKYKNQLKALALNQPIEANKQLRIKIDKLLNGITELKKSNQDNEESFEKEKELFVEFAYPELKIIEIVPKLTKIIPEPEVIPEPIIEIIPEAEPITELIPEPELEPELIPCPKCGKLVKGERGLKAHQSRWCNVKVEEVEEAEVNNL